ncbi:hypothetical protein TYRP_000682 [Tyrophagus putrescentiae]|nr:hypothetical protein TYRP_000682 [Tyrophagus putrescentiae]
MQEYLKPWNLTLESFFGRWKPVERRFEKPKLKLPVKMRPSTTTPKPQQRESPPVTNCTEPPKSLYHRLVRSSLAIVRYLQANIFVEMFLLSQGPEPHARWNNSFRRLASKLESWSPKSNCSQLIVNISVPQQ